MNNQTIKKPYGHSTMVLLGFISVIISLIVDLNSNTPWWGSFPAGPSGGFSDFIYTFRPLIEIFGLVGLIMINAKNISGLYILKSYLWSNILIITIYVI